MASLLPATPQSTCEFRFYEELGEFLAPERRKRSFTHAFDGTPSVKDRIESLGVPHTEVDLILVDGEPVPFSHKLTGGERVAVYPMFERFELGESNRLRPTPLREPRFVLDVHLGRLASYLRLLGFDTLYRNDYHDDELLRISRAQHRILLTRDTGLLKRAAVTHGAFLHATDPRRQLREVLDRFQLDARIAPFTRCARCNGKVDLLVDAPDEHDPDRQPPEERDPSPGERERRDPGPGEPERRDPGHAPPERDPGSPPEIRDPGKPKPPKHGLASSAVPPRVLAGYGGSLSRCRDCGQIYWPGSHLTRLRQRLAEVGVSI
ncbi:Mut7-C RNAse domain-containing protein [Lysobacter changpingensis]|uniref:Mut7-C RNAse domain-containing protein n=1 Tax=Lysobacter changpingensis TaxID=2792784 RepID=UPI001A8DD3DB|nr:Mut7-C RNAse domain-containing protein [Lysobacter changpingensis]